MSHFRILLVFISALFVFSCTTDDGLNSYSYDSESTIFASGTTVQFREILMVIRPYILSGDVKNYIVTDSLLNVKVRMNNSLWGTVNSLSLDTSAIDKEINGNYLVSPIALKYSIIAKYIPAKTVLTTAGEYSDLLRNYMIVEPGVYFCQVESFEIKLSDGSLKKVIPLISEMIEITENTRSLYLGDFEVEIK